MLSFDNYNTYLHFNVHRCRHLAESYSLVHATMAQPHKPCDALNDEFYENNGITNGADWYSVRGGMI